MAAARGRGGSLAWMIRYEEGSWVACPVVTFEWFLADSPTQSPSASRSAAGRQRAGVN